MAGLSWEVKTMQVGKAASPVGAGHGGEVTQSMLSPCPWESRSDRLQAPELSSLALTLR